MTYVVREEHVKQSMDGDHMVFSIGSHIKFWCDQKVMDDYLVGIMIKQCVSSAEELCAMPSGTMVECQDIGGNHRRVDVDDIKREFLGMP